jgi:hypothetical protein
MSLSKIAKNKNGDDVWGLLQPLAHAITSEHWDVFVDQEQFKNLRSGHKDRCKLITDAVLKPSIFHHFASTTLASACFEETLLYSLWTAQGILLKDATETVAKHLRYTAHSNGDLLTIHYVSEEDWSKSYRDKEVETEDGTIRFGTLITHAVADHFKDTPFLWMGNKDLEDDHFRRVDASGAERLPNTPHGLNCFQHIHNVVVVSALNPPPAHFGFMATRGVDGERVRTGLYRTACYQAIMRCSIRNPKDLNPKQVVVMDLSTAEWLGALFPGATIAPLPGMGLAPRKSTGGRPKRHTSNAAKQRAHKESLQAGWLAQLDAINGTRFSDEPYWLEAGDEQVRRDETLIRDRAIVSPPETGGTIYASIYDTSPLDRVPSDPDLLIDLLRELQTRRVKKTKAGLISPAHFDPDLSDDTKRGLANIQHVRGIWLDNDGGDVTPEVFASFFPYLRIVVWNSASHSAVEPRWRAFIPTTLAMSVDVHKAIIKQIELALNRKGYWTQKQLDKNERITSRLVHGFDSSKFNAAAVFYMPVQAADPKDTFFIDFNGPERGPLDVVRWIDHCILKLEPIIERQVAAPTTPIVLPKADDSLTALRKALLEQQASSPQGWAQAVRDEALSVWRTAPRGTGNEAFFTLAATLARTGMPLKDVETTLSHEAVYAHSKTDRRKEIKGIIKTLKKRGTM